MMKFKVLIITCLAMHGMVECRAQAAAPGHIRNVTPEGFKKIMDSLDNEIIIDLRTAAELQQGKIAGAQVIDFFGPDFEPSISKLDKDKTYLLYCAGGGRSSEAADFMQKHGFKNLYNLEEGFKVWVKKKMPVQKR